MKVTVAVLMKMLALCSVGSGLVDGEIKEFNWAGYPNVAPSVNLLDCWAILN
jgi:hypothetical protein